MDKEKKDQNESDQLKSKIKTAAKAASGNYIGAAKEALKSGALKKKLKRKLIKYALMACAPIIIALCAFGIFNGIKNEMINLITSAFSTTTGFFSKLWQFITDDYWIKLDETYKTYIIDTTTGKTLAYVEGGKKYVTDKNYLQDIVNKKWPNGDKTVNDLSDSEIAQLTNEFLSDKDTITKEYNIIDSYVKELGDQGISIKQLRMLGDADYEDESDILENQENKQKVDKNTGEILGADIITQQINKQKVEKYIAEFLRADIITQNMHKRHGNDKTLVDPLNPNHVDGGIYLYRTKSFNTINLTTSDFENGQYASKEFVEGDAYRKVEYLSQEEFMNKVENNDATIKYNYSLDDEGNLLVSEVTTTRTVEETPPANSGWFEGMENQAIGTMTGTGMIGDRTQVSIAVKTIPYKEYISKYAMPYEFLINLCQITQNPEFVYHVALLARNTDIALVLQDNITITKSTQEVYTEDSYFRNNNSSSTSGASSSLHNKYKTRTTTTTQVETPVLSIEYADAWSFYDEFDNIINTAGLIEDIGPTDITPSLPGTLPVHHPEKKDSETGEVKEKEYWDNAGHESDFITKKEQMNRTITVVSSYEQIKTNSVEKSKQFLGLLRNDDGKCPHDCYSYFTPVTEPTALKCAEEAVFNEDGTNVQYTIPGMDKTEAPLNKLTSGLQMLYSNMQSNSSGYRPKDKVLKDDDLYKEYYSEKGIYNTNGESAYVVKMQGLVEHLRYLMEFPANENYYKKDIGQTITDTEKTPGTPGGKTLQPGDFEAGKYGEYSEEEIELLYKLCQAECGGNKAEYVGHVACVVLNRVKCSQWPNTIKGVISQPSQFTSPWRTATPTQATKDAVDAVLKSGDTTGGAVFFRTVESAQNAGMTTTPGKTDKKGYICLFIDDTHPSKHVFHTSAKALSDLGAGNGSSDGSGSGDGGTSTGTNPAPGNLATIFPEGIPTTKQGIAKYLVTIQVPITKKDGTKTTTNLTIHKDVADQVKSVLKKAQDGGFKVYQIGGFSWRKISGSSKMSQHSLGLAVDINVNENYCVYPSGKIDAGSFWKPGSNEYSIPSNGVLVNAFKGIGWGWGGNWKSKKDYMHFSYTGG